MLSDRQLTILKLFAAHYTLTAAQVRRLLFAPGQDKDGRLTRRLLSTLVHAGLLNKTRCEVVNPLHGLTCPVYYPSAAGCKALALATGDDHFLLTPTETPHWQNLRHWVSLSDVRVLIDTAIRRQAYVAMPTFYNEFDVVNKDATSPADRYRLYTLVATNPKKLCCVPDAAFGLTAKGITRAFYIELELGSNSPQKAAAEKTPGYAALDSQKLFQRHFPDATDFRVLCVDPDPRWRDALRKSFRQKTETGELWKFVALTDLTPETLLHSPVFFPAGDGEPTPLVKGGGQ